MKYERIYTEAGTRSGYSDNDSHIRIYISTSGYADIAQDIPEIFLRETEKHQISVEVILTGSYGYYDIEPIVRIEKPGIPAVLFRNVDPEVAVTLVDDYIVKGTVIPEIVLGTIGNERINGIADISELPLFYLQNRIALRNCGNIDPENIDHYILDGRGYTGLDKVLSMSPVDVISELKKSGLRGKGGAGYLTADKWRICHDTESDEKYVVCNAVDGDPDSLCSKLLLESAPHSILEGVLIAAYAAGASQCYICVNSRNNPVIPRLEKALDQMREYNLLGQNILDSEFSADVVIREVEDSFILGEETALIRCIEGKQPMPYMRTEYPAVSGINNKPTLVNNLETLSCVSAIFQNSPEWYSSFGTDESRGTKIITLSGDVTHRYTVEVSFGTSLGNVINDIGGGTSDGKNIKAVRFGGPTGRYFDVDSLDIPIDYESMKKTDSIIGSGVISVYDDSHCAVEMTGDAVDYIQKQSCGKCVFCREGSFQIFEILNDISENNPGQRDLDLVIVLCEAMKEGCICNFGTTAPNPVLSSIKLFDSDYETHIKDRKCPAR